MFVPLLVLPLAAQLIAASDAVPKLDVAPSCRGAARAGYVATTQERLQICIDSEHRTRDKLAKDWPSFPMAARIFCLGSIVDFEPTYTELATCLEMRRDIAKAKPDGAKPDGATPAPPMRRPSAFTNGSGTH